MQVGGKVIIITGASSGIGAATARMAARGGARLVLSARRGERIAALAAAIAADGGEAAAQAGDVTDEATHEALVALAHERFGGLDAAFNNAGTMGAPGPLPAMRRDEWDAVIAANLTAAALAAKHQIPALAARGGGSIVFTSSFVGHTIGLPGMAAYAASKAGLVGLTQVLAVEHAAAGIRVNALMPGGTKTEMMSDPEAQAWAAGLHPGKRLAEAQEIAAAALFLLGGEASFVTGTAMLADGGNSIFKP
ncbi:SDR family oxidoreductase [Acuticoccus yangtzensis]|uniref:SDR family oxidoreductase n=1 Tax=Acuticoccus yangtzensis TaxID=1443441 RepID=UPI000949AF79|nr:SDR family oxidoreductase [Acuticoccus yangtzensis]